MSYESSKVYRTLIVRTKISELTYLLHAWNKYINVPRIPDRITVSALRVEFTDFRDQVTWCMSVSMGELNKGLLDLNATEKLLCGTLNEAGEGVIGEFMFILKSVANDYGSNRIFIKKFNTLLKEAVDERIYSALMDIDTYRGMMLPVLR